MSVSLLLFLVTDWRSLCSGDMYRWHRGFCPACFGAMFLPRLMLSNSLWSNLQARSLLYASTRRSMHPYLRFCPVNNDSIEPWSNSCILSKFGRMPSRGKKCGWTNGEIHWRRRSWLLTPTNSWIGSSSPSTPQQGAWFISFISSMYQRREQRILHRQNPNRFSCVDAIHQSLQCS